MNRFSAGVVSWPLARRNSQLLSALATYRLPFVNSSWSLLADFCNLSPTSLVALRARLSPLCFRCVRFVDLRWCGSWPLVAGLGGWD